MNTKRKVAVSVLFAFVLILTACPALAADETAAEIIKTAASIVVKYLVVALIFESVYSSIFQWTWFIRKAKRNTGVKSIVKFALGWIAVAGYPDINIMEELAVKIFHAAPGGGVEFVGGFITGLLIAGGSSGMFDVLNKLGFRDKVEMEAKITRVLADGPVAPQKPDGEVAPDKKE